MAAMSRSQSVSTISSPLSWHEIYQHSLFQTGAYKKVAEVGRQPSNRLQGNHLEIAKQMYAVQNLLNNGAALTLGDALTRSLNNATLQRLNLNLEELQVILTKLESAVKL